MRRGSILSFQAFELPLQTFELNSIQTLQTPKAGCLSIKVSNASNSEGKTLAVTFQTLNGPELETNARDTGRRQGRRRGREVSLACCSALLPVVQGDSTCTSHINAAEGLTFKALSRSPGHPQGPSSPSLAAFWGCSNHDLLWGEVGEGGGGQAPDHFCLKTLWWLRCQLDADASCLSRGWRAWP